MKILALVILTIVICGCKSVDLSRGDFAPPYTASIGGLEPELIIIEGSILHQNIVQWIRENQTGWERSMITYAPNVMIRNDNMNLNFGDGGVILNFNVNPKKDKWIQIEKDCNIKDLNFINKIKLKLIKNKEVKLLSPKNGILYETSIEGTVLFYVSRLDKHLLELHVTKILSRQPYIKKEEYPGMFYFISSKKLAEKEKPVTFLKAGNLVIKIIKHDFGTFIGAIKEIWVNGKLEPHCDGYYAPVINPEGTHYAYCAVSEKNKKQFVVFDDKKQDEYDRVDGVVFSPDGEQWAYTAENNGVRFAVINGIVTTSYRMNKKLKPAVFEHGYQPGGVGKLWWSPTNKHIIIALFDVGEKEHFSKLIMDGHEELAQFNHTYFYGVEWSSNGKHFAYVVKPPDTLGFRIFYDKKLIQSPFHVRDLAFSPDGEHFAYTINDSGSTFVIHDGKKGPGFETPHLMAKAPWAHHIGGLVFSPDSQHLAYAGRDGDKWFVICDGKKGILYDDILAKPIWDNGKLKYIAVKQADGTAKVILISEEIEHGK